MERKLIGNGTETERERERNVNGTVTKESL